VAGLDVSVRTERGCTVVTLSGELDVYSERALRKDLDGLDTGRVCLI